MCRLRLAGKLNRDLAVKDGLAVEIVDGALGLGWGRDIDEGVANWASGARVGRDRSGFAVEAVSAICPNEVGAGSIRARATKDASHEEGAFRG